MEMSIGGCKVKGEMWRRSECLEPREQGQHMWQELTPIVFVSRFVMGNLPSGVSGVLHRNATEMSKYNAFG